MRTKQQWKDLCAVWGKADAALAAYRPNMFRGTYPHVQIARDNWLEAVHSAAWLTVDWFRLDEEQKESEECHLTSQGIVAPCEREQKIRQQFRFRLSSNNRHA